MDCNSQNEHQFGMKNKTNGDVELNSKRSIHWPFKFTITVNTIGWFLSNKTDKMLWTVCRMEKSLHPFRYSWRVCMAVVIINSRSEFHKFSNRLTVWIVVFLPLQMHLVLLQLLSGQRSSQIWWTISQTSSTALFGKRCIQSISADSNKGKAEQKENYIHRCTLWLQMQTA